MNPELSERTLEEVVQRLADPDEHARYQAAYELHRRGRPALELALGLSAHEDPVLRSMACYVLGQIMEAPPRPSGGDPIYFREGIPILLHLLEHDPVSEVRAS